MGSRIELYEDNAGRLHWRDLSHEQVFVIDGPPFEATFARDAEAAADLGYTNWTTESYPADELPASWSAGGLIAVYERGEITIVRDPGLAGREYLGLPRLAGSRG